MGQGDSPRRKYAALADVAHQNVLRTTLATGNYTYWVCIYPADGSENVVSVPVYVTRK